MIAGGSRVASATNGPPWPVDRSISTSTSDGRVADGASAIPIAMRERRSARTSRVSRASAGEETTCRLTTVPSSTAAPARPAQTTPHDQHSPPQRSRPAHGAVPACNRRRPSRARSACTERGCSASSRRQIPTAVGRSPLGSRARRRARRERPLPARPSGRPPGTVETARSRPAASPVEHPLPCDRARRERFRAGAELRPQRVVRGLRRGAVSLTSRPVRHLEQVPGRLDVVGPPRERHPARRGHETARGGGRRRGVEDRDRRSGRRDASAWPVGSSRAARRPRARERGCRLPQ